MKTNLLVTFACGGALALASSLSLAREPSPAGAEVYIVSPKDGAKVKSPVTVVFGLPRNPEFLRELSQELKRACGAGGTVVEGGIEIQGDLGARVRDALEKRGYVVKG